MDDRPVTTLEQARERLRAIVAEAGLAGEQVRVKAREPAPEEAAGEGIASECTHGRGKEVLVEAQLRGSVGQAFTDAPSDFAGTVSQVLDLPLDSNARRAVFVATANAILAHLGLVTGTCHCKYPSMRECGWRVASALWAEYPGADIGLVGFHPGFVEGLAEVFGPERVRVTDLSPENVGQERAGVVIGNGAQDTAALIESSDLLLVSGSTVVNGTLESITNLASRGQVPLILYGVTAAGPAYLYNLRRVCPLSG
jgi:uncharacterized protein (DUF4213/DUF364 family)